MVRHADGATIQENIVTILREVRTANMGLSSRLDAVEGRIPAIVGSPIGAAADVVDNDLKRVQKDLEKVQEVKETRWSPSTKRRQRAWEPSA